MGFLFDNPPESNVTEYIYNDINTAVVNADVAQGKAPEPARLKAIESYDQLIEQRKNECGALNVPCHVGKVIDAAPGVAFKVATVIAIGALGYFFLKSFVMARGASFGAS